MSHLRSRPPVHGRATAAAAAGAAQPFVPSPHPHPHHHQRSLHGHSPGAGLVDFSIVCQLPKRKLTAHSMDSDDDGVPCPKPAGTAVEPSVGATDDEAVTLFPSPDEMEAMCAAEELEEMEARNASAPEDALVHLAPSVSLTRVESEPALASSASSSLFNTPRGRRRPSVLSLSPTDEGEGAAAQMDLASARVQRRERLRRRSHKLPCSPGIGLLAEQPQPARDGDGDASDTASSDGSESEEAADGAPAPTPPPRLHRPRHRSVRSMSLPSTPPLLLAQSQRLSTLPASSLRRVFRTTGGAASVGGGSQSHSTASSRQLSVERFAAAARVVEPADTAVPALTEPDAAHSLPEEALLANTSLPRDPVVAGPDAVLPSKLFAVSASASLAEEGAGASPVSGAASPLCDTSSAETAAPVAAAPAAALSADAHPTLEQPAHADKSARAKKAKVKARKKK
jgi:hypothetical protein